MCWAKITDKFYSLSKIADIRLDGEWADVLSTDISALPFEIRLVA